MKMSSRAALGAIAIAAMLGLTQSVCAIGQDYKKEVLSGKPTRLLNFLNCMSHTPYYGTPFVDQSYRRILVTEGIRRQRVELAI